MHHIAGSCVGLHVSRRSRPAGQHRRALSGGGNAGGAVRRPHAGRPRLGCSSLLSMHELPERRQATALSPLPRCVRPAAAVARSGLLSSSLSLAGSYIATTGRNNCPNRAPQQGCPILHSLHFIPRCLYFSLYRLPPGPSLYNHSAFHFRALDLCPGCPPALHLPYQPAIIHRCLAPLFHGHLGAAPSPF